MGRDTEERKCMVLLGTTAQQRGVGDEGGTQTDKGFDCCIEELSLHYERSIKQGSGVIGSMLQENNWLQYAGWIEGRIREMVRCAVAQPRDKAKLNQG